ncbi:MAG: hypothetical protein ACE5GE_06495, partial [Phycisphaerae bacterium]
MPKTIAKGKTTAFQLNRSARLVLMGLVLLTAWPRSTDAADRRFLVILANPTKTFPNGVPPEGLTNRATVNAQYFDTNPFNNIRSFAEFWAEISYGNVSVSGDTKGWISLPWPLAPPNQPDGTPIDPDFNNGGVPDLNLSTGYEYGAGELFAEDPLQVFPQCTFMCSGIPIDYNGGGNEDRARFLGRPDDAYPGVQLDLPDSELGFDPTCECCTTPTPEEPIGGQCADRQLPNDGTSGAAECPSRDAVGNCACPRGTCFFPVPHSSSACRANTAALCASSCGLVGFDAACRSISTLQCFIQGGTWVTVENRFYPPCPFGNDPNAARCPDDRGINESAIGKLTEGANIPSLPVDDGIYTPGERYRDVNASGRYDALHEPRFRLDATDDAECTDDNDFLDLDGSSDRDLPEPFEDFMIRWDPGPPPDGQWVPVDAAYVRSNYPLNTSWNVRTSIDAFFASEWGWQCDARDMDPLPDDAPCVYFKQQMYVLRTFPTDDVCNVTSNTCNGAPSVYCESDADCDFVRDDLEGQSLGDYNGLAGSFQFNDTAIAAWTNVDEVVWRAGNGVYDPPERWENTQDAIGNEISSKMQHAHEFNLSVVPEPGTYEGSDADEVAWYEPFWAGRYGTQPPVWGKRPRGTESPILAASPKMVPFDPDNPRNPGEGPTEPRQFVASGGRLDREE